MEHPARDLKPQPPQPLLRAYETLWRPYLRDSDASIRVSLFTGRRSVFGVPRPRGMFAGSASVLMIVSGTSPRITSFGATSSIAGAAGVRRSSRPAERT
jgi:hypothetical protein